MKRFILTFICVTGLVFGQISPTFCQTSTFVGASGILDAMKAASSSKPLPPPNPELDNLKSDTKSYEASVSTLSPEEASSQWLHLEERYLDATHVTDIYRPSNQTPTYSFQDLLSALPPENDWNELTKQIRAHHLSKRSSANYAVLRVLADVLNDDYHSVRLDSDSAQGYGAVGFDQALKESLSSRSNSTADAIQSFQEQIASSLIAGRSSSYGASSIQVPDLVTLVGASKATPILTQAIHVAKNPLTIETGEETRRLAASIALKEIKSMKAPQWGLVTSIQDVPLYTAIQAKFGNKSSGSYDDPKGGADVYYLLGLIAEGKTAQANKFVTSTGLDQSLVIPDQAFDALTDAGYGSQVYAFIKALLISSPTPALWEDEIRLGASLGKSNETLALARQAVSNPKLSPEQQRKGEAELCNALLANNDIDEGVSVLRKMIQAKDSSKTAQINRFMNEIKLAKIGNLTGHPSWFEEGISEAKADIPQQEELVASSAIQVANLLEAAGRGPEAESVLKDAISTVAPLENTTDSQNKIRQFLATRAESEQYGSQYNDYEYLNEGYSYLGLQGGAPTRSLMVNVLGLYTRSGRYQDVITLLDQYDEWFARDLSDVLANRDNNQMPIGYMAAKAFANTGQIDKARTILHSLLNQLSNYDPAYQLLADIDGPSAIPYLDDLYNRDHFEKRPLIWKAHILLAEGNAKEAEQVARQAVAIDPSDGESPHGDRMRAFAELSNALAAEGDSKQAADMLDIVTAIRIAEHADDLKSAGLLTSAIKTYEEALGHFDNAYCIQSRLAIQLAAQGRFDEAAVHYRRAYELMPSSFGRIESHCFGCERAFEGDRQRSIADKVFSSFLVTQPLKPQVHYLMGYLREQEGRYGDALENYKSAVSLDPDYINAWTHIQGLESNVQLTQSEQDEVTFNLLRIDPLGKHSSADLGGVGDVKTLWKVVQTGSTMSPKSDPVTLYPLAASAANWTKLTSDPQFSAMASEEGFSAINTKSPITPSGAVASNNVLTALGQYLDGLALYGTDAFSSMYNNIDTTGSDD